MSMTRTGSQSGRTWLVLGASSAVARAFVRAVATQGGSLILAGRDLADLDRSAADAHIVGAEAVEVWPFDATDPAAIQALVTRAKAEIPAAELDVFLAFGLMPDQAAMEADPDLAATCVEATFTGAARVLLGLLGHLEAGGTGRVVVLGSVAGDRGRKKNFVYGAAKAGLAAFTSGLRGRLHGAGVSVTLIKPGFIDSAMTWGLKLGPFPVASPEACAQACLAAAEKRRDVVYFPWIWEWVMLLIRNIPERIFKKLSI